MIRRLTSHVQQWAGLLSLFLVLGGGTAYAIDEWTGANIKDGTLTSLDYRNEDIRAVDVRDASRPGGGLTGAEIVDESLLAQDIKPGSLTGNEVMTGGLTGHDIADTSIQEDDLGSSVVKPKAIGIFEGPCITDNNCPLTLNRGITSVSRSSISGHYYCVGAGPHTDRPFEVTATQDFHDPISTFDRYHFAAGRYTADGFRACPAGTVVIETGGIDFDDEFNAREFAGHTGWTIAFY